MTDFTSIRAAKSAAGVAVTATGFDGNLTTTDDTVQEIAQKLDDLGTAAHGSTHAAGGSDLVLGVMPTITMETGEFYSLRGLTTAASNHGALTGAGVLNAIPVWLADGTYDRIGVISTVAAVSTWRLGVYPTNPNTGRPDGQTLILDAGTVDMNATAGQLLKTVTLTIATPGVYWLAVLVDAYTASPTVQGWAAGNAAFQPPMLGMPTSNTAGSAAQSRIARLATGVATGSMPATFPSAAWANGAVKIIVRGG